jgi:two-component system sensor histidine kinase GlrK
VPFRTRSILQLTVFGFLIVAALLMVALFLTAREFEAFTRLSQETASQSASTMRLSSELVEHASALERNARQYTVLENPALLTVYRSRRAEFRAVLAQLRGLAGSGEMDAIARDLLARENEAFRQLEALDGASTDNYAYPALLESAHTLSRLTSQLVDEQVASLRGRTEQATQTLSMQTVVLVLSALLVATLFVTLIIRPLRQVDRAIRRLGRGSYEQSIAVSGPRDLQHLGERLDWLRHRLEQLEHQRHAFLRHVSHELKTPLASMQESTALLRDGIVGTMNEEQRRILDILNTNCQRLLSLIESLLRHNASSFQALDVMPQPVNPSRLLDDVLAAHELDIMRRGIKVQRDEEKHTLSGDPERIRVIMDNLISNAIRFSPENGTLFITLGQQGGHALLDVRDEGPGVAREDRERIFTAFYRGRHQAGDPYQGTGLGLAIAREYATASGGDLRITESDTGACFRAIMPIASA